MNFVTCVKYIKTMIYIIINIKIKIKKDFFEK